MLVQLIIGFIEFVRQMNFWKKIPCKIVKVVSANAGSHSS